MHWEIRAYGWVWRLDPQEVTCNQCFSFPPLSTLSKVNKNLFYIYNKNKILATVWVMDWKMARHKMWEDVRRPVGSWINLREGWYWLDLIGSRRVEVRRKMWRLRGDRSCSPIPKGSQHWPKRVQICPSALKGLRNLISFPLNSYFSPSQKNPTLVLAAP